MSTEFTRLSESSDPRAPWRKWGPYLAERQWGTVREDHSPNGDAWNDFSHDQARSRAYRWGEDGIAGISDDRQHLCFALTLWNGRDPILKERLFGLTNSEGNHGEDVKEYYFYLDSTPTHSYMKYLYKYPQAAYPYDEIVRVNKERSRTEHEYELGDTGVFDEDRYFDVVVEYAKAAPDDILVRVTVCNRGPEPATIHLLPTLWFRNTWSWNTRDAERRPSLEALDDRTIAASHDKLGERVLHADGSPALLFTENETNHVRFQTGDNRTPYVKDAFHNLLISGDCSAVNPGRRGTKAAAHYILTVAGNASETVQLRLTDAIAATSAGAGHPFGRAFDEVFEQRRSEADEFYHAVIPASLGTDAACVMRQALAGMLWSKQLYYYDVDQWLAERGASPFKAHQHAAPRNNHWHHMYNNDVISMPDKWEYPWYAAWDLAFHVLSLTLVDPDFGKQQLDLILQERYLHPNGQIPAYEWNFGDVNPPVHAWATIFTYTLDKSKRGGHGDLDWLERAFHRLIFNFNWWVNRKDPDGNNVFEGGFLGLDNIGVFDRSAPLPTGGHLEQADGTAWMALFCQNMLEIAIELAKTRPVYLDLCVRFIEHFLMIASSMVHSGEVGMWDEEDGFFYDVLRTPDGRAERLKVRSMVGLLPLCATTVFDGRFAAKHPDIINRLLHFADARPELTALIHNPSHRGQQGRILTSVLNETSLRRVLSVMLDEREFLSPYGLRSISRVHLDHPYRYRVGDREYNVGYLPAESDSGMFGGNSNWRGPIWMPVNALIVRALLHYYTYYGDDFTIECPTGSGRHMTLYQVAEELSRRLSSIFLRNGDGRRPVFGGIDKFQNDPHWRDLILFHEYFHGDNGAGLGASHQTGWTGVVARLMHLFAVSPASEFKDGGQAKAAAKAYAAPGRK
jgi:hypothetical protein